MPIKVGLVARCGQSPVISNAGAMDDLLRGVFLLLAEPAEDEDLRDLGLVAFAFGGDASGDAVFAELFFREHLVLQALLNLVAGFDLELAVVALAELALGDRSAGGVYRHGIAVLFALRPLLAFFTFLVF